MDRAEIERLARRPLPVWVRPLTTLFAWAVALCLLLYFFAAVKMVLLDLLGAAAVASMLRPLLRYARGPRWLRGATIGVAFLAVAAGVLFGLGWLLKAPVRHELQQWPQLRQSIDSMLLRWSDRFDLPEPLDVQSAVKRLAEFVTGSGGDGGAGAVKVIGRTADFTINLLVTLVLVFLGMIYILVEDDRAMLGALGRMLPPPRQEDLRGLADAMDFRLRWWLIGMLIAISIIGVASWVGYFLVGLKFALPLALFAGLAEIVPNIGALTAFAVAVLVAATQGTGVLAGVIVVHSITLLLESHVIQPLVMRGAVHVPPLVTLFSVVLWASVFGFGGLVLALPIDLLIWSAAENFILHERATPIPKNTPPAPADRKD